MLSKKDLILAMLYLNGGKMSVERLKALVYLFEQIVKNAKKE